MGTAILGAMAMNVASSTARQIMLRNNSESEEAKGICKKAKKRIAENKQYADWKKTVEAKVCSDAHEIKKLLKNVAGIRECYYIAACNIDRECADKSLAEMNKSCLQHNNYFGGDDWNWYLAAGEFLDAFSQFVFKKYGTCYWDNVQKHSEYNNSNLVDWDNEND